MTTEERLNETIQFLKDNYSDGFSIKFTGGKESSIVKHIIDKYLPECTYELIYTQTGMESDGHIDYLKANYPEIRYTTKTNVCDLWEKYGKLPSVNDQFCCRELHKESLLPENRPKYKTVVQGKRQADRVRRSVFVPKKRQYKNNVVIQPLRTWTDEDVTQYIKDNPEIKIEPQKSSSCVPCIRIASRAAKEKSINENPVATKKFYDTVHKIYQSNKELRDKFETEQKYINHFLNNCRIYYNESEF